VINRVCLSTAPFVTLAALMFGTGAKAADSDAEFEGWDLEPNVAQAHLVVVARVASISKLTVVEGAKTDVALREYRFEPVRVLKGLFQRDQLSMTASDLGCPPDNALEAPPLKEGEFRLLILAQQRGNSFGCVSAPRGGATTFAQRVPQLTGVDDPLVGVIETLIRVADSQSRRQRAKLLVDSLAEAHGVAAVPLLTSLKLRADWAAAQPRAFTAVGRLARESATPVRLAALEVLSNMLAHETLTDDSQQPAELAGALREVLESDEAHTRVRLVALEALGRLLAQYPHVDWAREFLIAQTTAAATYAERTAAADALSQLPASEVLTPLVEALADLPLDETSTREAVFARALTRLLPDENARRKMNDAPRAEQALIDRVKRSLAAQQSLEAEIDVLGRIRSTRSLPLLLEAARQYNQSFTDRDHLAWALGRLGDDRAVPVLAAWLRGDTGDLKHHALTALETLDSPAAARELRPLLKTESHLPYKLRIARLLGRHNITDGYALAAEHLADDDHTPAAALALAAIDDPRTTDDLEAILQARPDRRWRAAALAGLAAVGHADAVKQLADILADERHPLAADAAEAAGLAASMDLLPQLANLVQSRNKAIALAALVALRRQLSGVRVAPLGLAAVDPAAVNRPPVRWGFVPQFDDEDAVDAPPVPADISAKARNAIFDAVTALALDPYVDANLRQEAFAVARLVRGDDYDQFLADLADQAELEGSPLLAAVQRERRRTQSSGGTP
jgi:HEAT repeat protein